MELNAETQIEGSEPVLRSVDEAAMPDENRTLAPIRLDRRQLRGRNFLLGNKQGSMLHLPAANGASPRTIHRSKWYGASRFGRKFLEGFVCNLPDGTFLCRRQQYGFVTDGVVAQREYWIDGAVSERYFVPDYLPVVIWSLESDVPLALEPYFDMRFYRARGSESPYHTEEDDRMLILDREVETTGLEVVEGIDTGGTPEAVREMLWVACAFTGASLRLHVLTARRRPMWYSLDAARRRYLRRLALQEKPIVEHAPLWELAAEWVYAPCTAQTDGTALAVVGFGDSRVEAVEAVQVALASRDRLEDEKRHRLSDLLSRTWFSSGRDRVDRAYSHVMSRLTDCLVVSNPPRDARGEPVGSATILAGNAYFQEAWKRDENISVGGLLATGQYDLAREIIDSTWQRQDDDTGRLPLRFRVGELPGYTSSDGTLWALLRLNQYVALTGDGDVLQTKMPLIAHFFRRSLAHTWQGLLPSGGIAVSGHEWETWMDTEFSARLGYPIEIQLLWLAVLRSFRDVISHVDLELAEEMGKAHDNLGGSLDLFRHRDHLVDHLTPGLEQVDLFTPNSFFWTILDLRFDADWEEGALALARRELGGVSGVRTLARFQWESVLGVQITALARAGRPLPSVGKVNYHRGVEWNWLSQLFVAGELRYGRPEMAFDHYLARQVHDATNSAGLGGVSEVFDHRGPAGPDFQTWSMTGLLESLQRFLGVEIDVPSRTILVRPQKPRRWPHLKGRKWYGASAFDVWYTARRGEQQLCIDFLGANPQSLMLQIELPLPRGRNPRAIGIDRGDGEDQLRDWEVVQRPDRVVVRTEAGARQRIRMVS